MIRLPVQDVSAGRDRTLKVVVPDDPQWKRIVNRLGEPAFVIVVATDPKAIHPKAFSVADAELVAYARRAGNPVDISATNQLPWAYSSPISQPALRFAASAADRIDLTVRMTPSTVPQDAFLMVFPLWNHLDLWDWADGMSMGQGLFALASLVIMFVGVAVLFVAVVVGLAPLRPTR